jgi:poly(hydroxyalkanoate) depolymerase family esterase
MPGLDETLHRLAEYRERFRNSFSPTTAPRKAGPGDRTSAVLTETKGFGSNPGNLRMLSFVPDLRPPKAALVVVLHGCTQDAAGYDQGAGWSTLAARFGFALLYPEQQKTNNPGLCFNWFMPEDTTRGEGEVASIREMIDRMVADHGLDPARVGITGLSAGGAMSAAMLACYPESFAEAAIFAGLPYGIAGNVHEAFAAMFQGTVKPREAWADLVRQASPHPGPWPRVSIWHGTEDTTVMPVNGAESVKQWTALHDLPAEPSAIEDGAGFTHRLWRGQDGDILVSSYEIAGMGHGTPIAAETGSPDERCGHAGPYMLDVGISSTYLIAQTWGLIGEPMAPAATNAGEPPRPSGMIARLLRAVGLTK